jgi:prenyltransferase beta subunit
LPEIADVRALSWVIQAWQKDLKSEVRLTYKGGFTLMALARHRNLVNDRTLVKETIEYLAFEQNEDGGFGPWKGHPIGSDPWSTGITLAGLTAWPDLIAKETVEKALDWLCETQLGSGLWPCHFIDEGSAYAYWGLCNTIEYLEGIN